MEDNLKGLSSVELNMLVQLADDPKFAILQKLHSLILKEMKEIAFKRVDATEDLRISHAIQIGHQMAWERDGQLKSIVANYVKLKSSKEAREKKFDNQ